MKVAAITLAGFALATSSSTGVKTLDPHTRDPHHKIQSRFCTRSVCWTAERWAKRSLAQYRKRRHAERTVSILQNRMRTMHKTRTLASASTSSDWRSRQIAAAEVIGRESSGDPWPNCPDPFDGQGSWDDTVGCENCGSWFDSPVYFRCGLQFDPAWESRFGRLCP